MANQHIGSVPHFGEGYNYDEWIELLEAWLEANDITEEAKKRAIFLTNLGNKSYHTLRALVQPNKPTEQTYQVCKEILQKHYSPKPTEIVQRYRFYTCTQKVEETIPQFVATLRQLSEGCNFQELDNMIRDRLVVGCRDTAIQRKLLSEPSLTLKNAYQTATAMEIANKDVEKLKVLSRMPDGSSPTVDKIQDRRPSTPQPFKKWTQTKHQQRSSPDGRPTTPKTCWRCGGQHAPPFCRFKDEQCFKCQKFGHTKSQCENVQKYKKARSSHHLEEDEESDGECEPVAKGTMSHIRNGSVNKIDYQEPYKAQIILNGFQTEMEIDTGSPWTMISNEVYSNVGRPDKLTRSKLSLKTYTGSIVPIVGEAQVDVKLDNSHTPRKLSLIVVEKGVNLLGRDWIQEAPEILQSCVDLQSQAPIQPPTVHNVQSSLQDILSQHKQAFDCTKLGKLEGYQAKVHAQENAEQGFFYKAAPVPYAMRDKVDEALDDLIELGVIQPVKFADYACPIVVVKKPDGKVRLCGNYKLTANKVLRVEHYPLPSLEDMLQGLEGGQKFSKLDLSHAYHQVELDPEARKFTTINTHRGLFQYARLPFGIASAPALFQRTMETLLAEIPMCRPYLDDIIISGRTDEEHVANLEAVLDCLEKNGLRLKKAKCQFMMNSVEFLGHKLDQQGIRPLPQKMEDILQAPRPVNQSQLKAYLGLLGYYRRFLPNLSTEIAPLTELLKGQYVSTNAKGTKRHGPDAADPKFKWGPKEEDAFKKSKQQLVEGQVLTHYDVKKPLLLQADASPYGVGAVISHLNEDGQEQPIAFASRTLSKAERNYAHYEKEGLSIIFGLKKFHKYLYGRPFTIVTDHKPLLGLFGPKPSSPMASARVSRWHMILSAYDYSIEYKEGEKHQNADALSRLPIQEEQTSWNHPDLAELEEVPAARIHLLTDLDTHPVDAQEVKKATKKDKVLARVKNYILEGWPATRNLPDEMKPFAHKKEELSLEDDIVLWGMRVVIPDNRDMKTRILDELHSTHPGIVKMKALARSYVWWPAIDKELEKHVRECAVCQEHQNDPPHAPIHPWEFPENPWYRLHIDYAFIEGQDVLVVVDAHSKWIEAVRVGKSTAAATVTAMRRLFATHGIPETIVSDNGTQFISEEFETFLSSNGIEHVQTAPKHPSSNGLAERAVQTVKHGVKKTSGNCLEKRIQLFLFHYRLTPQATTGKSPCELLFRRKIRSKLDQVRPNLNRSVKKRQSTMKQEADRKSKAREFSIHDKVLVKNFSSGTTWLYGKVVDVVTESLYIIELNDGRQVRRHVDHMRHCSLVSGGERASPDTPPRTSPHTEVLPLTAQYPTETEGSSPLVPSTSDSPSSNSEQNSTDDSETISDPVQTEYDGTGLSEPDSSMSGKRVSNRNTKTPSRFKEFIVYR